MTKQKCTRCKKREPREGLKSCEYCAQKMREINAKSHARKLEWGRSEKGRQGQRRRQKQYRLEARGGAPSFLEVARWRDRKLIKWAEQHGRLPTLREAMKICGFANVAGAGFARRRAFRLLDVSHLRGGTYGRVPYPVPEELIAPEHYVWAQVRWEEPKS